MAHVKLGQTGTTSVPLYLIDRPVGRGQANMRDDVLVVQFFLRALAGVKAAGTGDTYQVPGAAPLTIDGAFGNETNAAIVRFQKVLSAASGGGAFQMQQDGIVHPASGSVFGTRTGSLMSIVRLNLEYRFTFGNNMMMRIDIDPLFPRQLTEKFYLST